MLNKCCQKNSKKQQELQSVKNDLDILNDVNRLRILCFLKEHKEICVCEIYEALNLPQNLASYHLGKLKEAGFVTSRKEGANVIYRSGEKKIAKLFELIKFTLTKHMANSCCDDSSVCACGCDTNRENKLCELTKPHNNFDMNKILPLLNKPKYVCRCCGRLANKAENLCNPELLIKK